ncbi:hypothetical protein ATJ93_2308 [Halopiger aswanensis]|uniref:Uncharacterized protein n=1 Tax=Halopiger aswanensis TaxID=148449 RepID=A0A3R7GW46_9EURY|nr:hypothetical protein ATJ93_2308 [Halopiger aswanensis]
MTSFSRRGTNRVRYPSLVLKGTVTSPDTPSDPETPVPAPDTSQELTAHGYRITVDDGRDTFYAIRLSEPDSDTAWIMSDTVRSPREMR